MIPPEILKEVRRIQILTRALVNDMFAGQYHSAFKGRGVEFDEVREYQPGDDVRRIDWNVTARVGRPFVKSYREERELTVFLLVDVSPSQDFGTQTELKSRLVARMGATLAFSAIQNNDKIGLMLFTDRVERFVPAAKGKRHVLRVIRELLYHEPVGRGTDIAVALEQLNRALTRRAVVFLVSDFLAPDYERPLQIVSHRHDLIPIVVRDRREAELPRVRNLELVDPETGESLLVDTHSRAVQRRLPALAAAQRERFTRWLRAQGLDSIEVQTGASYVDPLRRFFRRRGARR